MNEAIQAKVKMKTITTLALRVPSKLPNPAKRIKLAIHSNRITKDKKIIYSFKILGKNLCRA
jgi:hypothetical protein